MTRNHEMVGLELRLYLGRDPEIRGEVVGVAPVFTGTSGDFRTKYDRSGPSWSQPARYI